MYLPYPTKRRLSKLTLRKPPSLKVQGKTCTTARKGSLALLALLRNFSLSSRANEERKAKMARLVQKAILANEVFRASEGLTVYPAQKANEGSKVKLDLLDLKAQSDLLDLKAQSDLLDLKAQSDLLDLKGLLG
jgi:hypothetical protein